MLLPSVLFKILNPLCLLNATCLNQRSILFLALVVNLAGRYYEDDLHPKYCSTIDLALDISCFRSISNSVNLAFVSLLLMRPSFFNRWWLKIIGWAWRETLYLQTHKV